TALVLLYQIENIIIEKFSHYSSWWFITVLKSSVRHDMLFLSKTGDKTPTSSASREKPPLQLDCRVAKLRVVQKRLMHSYSYISYSETNIIFIKGRVQYNMKNKGFALTLISFLWKPKSFFTNLKESPNITAPFVMILLLNVVLPIISTILLGKFDELIMRELTFSTITGLITNFGFLLISWGFITFLYRLLKIRNRAKVILSVLLYALLSYSYISILLGLIQPLWFSMMGTEN